MKKLLTAILTLALVLAVLGGCGKKSETMTLYTWEGMFPPEVLEGFTKETGIQINYTNFDTDENMLARLEAAKGGDYDVVIADDYIIETVIAEGLAQKLDTGKLQNWGNINPVFQGQFFDPANEYTVPYGSGVQTIVYNPKTVSKEIRGYADLWDESLKDNVAVIGNYRVVNGMALKVMGESYNTEDPAVIAQAGKKLLELAPNIRLIKNDNLQDDLLSGEVGAAVMYTSQVTLAMLQDPELRVVYPTEGVGFGIMGTFIPSAAPNGDAAHKFIDYVLRPEISAQCFEYMGYYCTNKAAEGHINEAYRSFLTLPESVTGGEMIQTVSAEAEEAHNKAWTEFRSACG
ncbi:MAG: spermidine/putrescine ABC transporter substrate-binding protein [Angelakisella sp.]|jgi:spermidine/putrescine transport system substrate-binding protein|nr:spermidine/putrescine ABC transporter substrate-binding protein [Angelakisella sp.]